ncbi:MAG: hypothetical protein KBB39_10925 [Phycicoccus sp.]|nr:hypothetical protein [Phycicoccus sp.]
MISLVTWAIVGLGALTILVAAIYARTDRLIDDRVLALVALLEAAVLVQVVRGLSDLSHVVDDNERLTLVAYLLSLPVVPLGTAFMAIKEKSRWSMAAIAIGAFAVAVMMLRCQQIWDTL